MENEKPVLVIEIDPVLLDLICMALQRNGYDAFPFKSSNGVLEKIKEIKPGHVILDLFLPGCDTNAFLKSIRLNLASFHGKIIVLSALGFSEIVQNAKDNGADAFLAKPFDIDRLIEAIRSLGD
jgi:two-component system, response regulator, stage 0 sporulation protein F